MGKCSCFQVFKANFMDLFIVTLWMTWSRF